MLNASFAAEHRRRRRCVSPSRSLRSEARCCSARTSVGRHQRALASSVDRGEQRGEGDDRLARSDVALQESVHGQGRRQVARDLSEDATLRRREREAVPGEEATNERGGRRRQRTGRRRRGRRRRTGGGSRRTSPRVDAGAGPSSSCRRKNSSKASRRLAGATSVEVAG